MNQLFEVYERKIVNGITDQTQVFEAIYKKLEEQLEVQAKELNITQSNELNPRTILILRLCKMLNIHNTNQTAFIYSALIKIEQNYPEDYKFLEKEFAWASDTRKPMLWLECIPKFLWLMSNGNNYDLIDQNTLQNSIVRQENCLYAGLRILGDMHLKTQDMTRCVTTALTFHLSSIRSNTV